MPFASSPLWVITSYYNPANYRTRRDNFKIFRKHLNVPLLVIELSRPGEQHLTAEDGEIVLHLTGEDRIWQKERLLNIGLRELPPHVDYVAWIDCDVVFEDDGWATKAVQRLSKNDGMLQLFETCVHLPPALGAPEVSLAACAACQPLWHSLAIARAVAASDSETDAIKSSLPPAVRDQYRCNGMAWSARRATIAASGFYDRNVIGGGDAVHVFAAFDDLETFWALRQLTAAHKQDHVRWMAHARASGLFTSVDALDHRLYHLWHGRIEDRDYRGRYDALFRNDYDPTRDIALAPNETLVWTDPRSRLASDVGAYFFSRREDGAG